MTTSSLYTRNTSGHAFLEYCETKGVNIEQLHLKYGEVLLPGAGTHYADFNVIAALFEDLSEQTNDPHYGLNWALAQPDDFRSAGPIMHIINQTISVRSHIALSMDYLKSFTNALRFSFVEIPEENIAKIKCSIHPNAKECTQLLEHTFGTISRIARFVFPDFKFTEVRFQHAGNPDNAIYQEVFGSPVFFNSQHNFLSANASYLGRNTLDVGPIVRKALDQYLKFQIKRNNLNASSLDVTVGGIIAELLGTGQTNLPAVATLLGISTKKLQRSLKAENISYSEILDDTRKKLAARYLSNNEIKLSMIALMLDYSSQETFIQAFHRWYGYTPTEYRMRNKSKINEVK